jgi:hypothetical protein
MHVVYRTYFYFSFRVPCPVRRNLEFARRRFVGKFKWKWKWEKECVKKTPDIVFDVRRVNGKKLLTSLWGHEKIVYHQMKFSTSVVYCTWILKNKTTLPISS